LVHLHTLWGGQYSFGDLTGIVNLAKRYPMVMTLRDGWMLTGHCACPIGCERWKTGCGKCPDLKRPPALKHDLTAINWKRKRRTIQKSNLHITVVSSWLKTQIEQSPIFAGKPVSVVHNSIDETEFMPGNQRDARKELGIPENAFAVLLAGKPSEGLNRGMLNHAMKAFNQINEPSFLPLLLGYSAQQFASGLTIPCKKIPFQKTSEGVAQCYQAADLTVVPSEYETFGRVAAESQFCGTPVLAFATGGLTDVVDEQKTGWVAPFGDINGMVGRIKSIINDRHELDMRARTCRQWSLMQFSKEKISKDYHHVYETVLSERNSN